MIYQISFENGVSKVNRFEIKLTGLLLYLLSTKILISNLLIEMIPYPNEILNMISASILE